MGERFRTMLVDPPWPQRNVGRYRDPQNGRPDRLPYPTMTLDEIGAVPVGELADTHAHCWVWTTNQFLGAGLGLLNRWGFRYLACITWVKPSGLGAWFVSRTQHLLMGYRGKLDMRERYRPTVLFANPVRHSQKPDCSYELIEAVSHPARLELFARKPRDGWACWGNELGNWDARRGAFSGDKRAVSRGLTEAPAHSEKP